MWRQPPRLSIERSSTSTGKLCGSLHISLHQAANCFYVTDNRVAHMLQRGYRMVRGFFIAEAAGILNQNRPEAQVRALPACRIDADFQRNAGDEKAANAAIAQRNLQVGSFEGRHRNL